jgi:hypothetical protein
MISLRDYFYRVVLRDGCNRLSAFSRFLPKIANTLNQGILNREVLCSHDGDSLRPQPVP